MKPLLGILWALSPAALVNFPLEVAHNGLPHWPAPNEFIPREEGGWNHYAKNALAAAVKADWGFWGQFLAFIFWFVQLLQLIF